MEEAHEGIHVDADPGRCFAIASDFARYPEWALDVKDVSVLARDDTGRATRVEYHAAAVGRRIRYVLDYDFADAPAAFTWSLVEGDMLRGLDGRYAFARDEAGAGTRVEYDLRVELSVSLPGIVKRRAAGVIVGGALRDLKRAAETPATTEVDADEAEETPAMPSAGDPPPDDGGEHAEPSARVPPIHPDAVAFEEVAGEARTLPAPSVVESVVSELIGAMPDVRDHVLEAADALLEAAKALLDAADRVVRQQRGGG